MATLEERTARFREIKLTFIEFLLSPSLEMNSLTISQINDALIDEIYEVERVLLNYTYEKSYEAILNKFTTKNLCDFISEYQEYKIYDQLQFNKNECLGLGNGILTKGIKTVIVTSLEEIRYYISTNQTQWSQINRERILIDTISKYKKLQKYVETPLIMLIEMIKNARTKGL